MTKLLVVSLLLQGSDSKVGSVTAQGRFKNSIEHLFPDQVEVLVTDCYKYEEDIGGRKVDYLMINEPPTELQDKNGWLDWYCKIIDAIDYSRAGIQLHGEHAVIIYDGKYNKYWAEMIPRISDIYQITPDLCSVSYESIVNAVYQAGYPSLQVPEVEYLPSCGINNPEVMQCTKSSRKICYASRIAPRKKPNNFIRLMGMMFPDAPGFLMYGDISPGIHNVQLENEMAALPYGKDTYYMGAFQSEYCGDHRYVNPSANYLVVWGGAQIGRGNACQMSPRIELAVLESLQHGTIPILFNETVPEWFPKDAYIGINWLDINHISKVDGMQNAVDTIRTRLSEIETLAPCTLESICSNAIKAVMDNTGVIDKLSNFISDKVINK